MNLNSNENLCPRCHAAPLHSWRELSDDEREVVKRLPRSGAQTLEERIKRNRWCTRCWHEESDRTLTA